MLNLTYQIFLPSCQFQGRFHLEQCIDQSEGRQSALPWLTLQEVVTSGILPRYQVLQTIPMQKPERLQLCKSIHLIIKIIFFLNEVCPAQFN